MDQSSDALDLMGLRAPNDSFIKLSLSLIQLFKVFQPLNRLISARQ